MTGIFFLWQSSGTAFQNHIMLSVGTDFWRPTGPTSSLKQIHLEQVAQEHVEVSSDYLQRRKLYSLARQPVPVLSHPQWKEVFPHVQLKLPSSLCPFHIRALKSLLCLPTFLKFPKYEQLSEHKTSHTIVA